MHSSLERLCHDGVSILVETRFEAETLYFFIPCSLFSFPLLVLIYSYTVFHFLTEIFSFHRFELLVFILYHFNYFILLSLDSLFFPSLLFFHPLILLVDYFLNSSLLEYRFVGRLSTNVFTCLINMRLVSVRVIAKLRLSLHFLSIKSSLFVRRLAFIETLYYFSKFSICDVSLVSRFWEMSMWSMVISWQSFVRSDSRHQRTMSISSTLKDRFVWEGTVIPCILFRVFLLSDWRFRV